MKTGICPRCDHRLILVTRRCCTCPSAGHRPRDCPRAMTRTVVRRHACGTRIEPRRVLGLPAPLGEGKFT